MDGSRWIQITDVTTVCGENLDMRVSRETGELNVYLTSDNQMSGHWVTVTGPQARQIRDALNEAYPND